jgi:outer membrane lipoprotein SlyB
MVDLNTQSVSRASDSRGNRTAKVAGGTAAVGAIIGAIAGGGKGAAIGAGAGAAAGAGAEVVTKGQRVKIPSETRLTFVLDNAVRI